MLTPAFELSQDDSFVIATIKTPYVKISDVDFFIDGNEFKFYVKPYFLRLNLPAKVIEDGREGATYDVEKGTFTVRLPKLHQGEHFEGLDMLTSLLSPRKKPKIDQPLIEVINDDSRPSGTTGDSSDENSDFEWEIEQVLCEDDVSVSLEGPGEEGKYGFANQRKGIFVKRQEELYEISDVPDPESLTLSERRLARLAAEDVKFDPEHYLADFFDEETIQPYLKYSPPWDKEYEEQQENMKSEAENSKEKEKLGNMHIKDLSTPAEKTTVPFTEEEKDKLRHLPNKEYIFDDQVQQSLLLGLVDIIFAYAYNHRTTEGENTVESGWTINKISSTLCFFETFTNINDVITSCYRRCLCYPLHRNWNLVQLGLEDTKKIFAIGKRRLLKCLLETHGLFNEDDPRYILNDLYITDYCVWIQTVSKKKLKSLAQSLQKINIDKKDLGWQLEELEKAGLLVNEEYENEREDSEEEEEEEEDTQEDGSGVSDEETESSDFNSTTTDSTSNDSHDENLEIRIGNLKLSSTEGEMDGPGKQENATKNSNENEKIIVLSSETFDT